MTKEEKTSVEDLYNFELSTGVVLRAKSIPPGVFLSIMGKNPPPDPPTYYDPIKDLSYTNVDDPGYMEKMKHHDSVQSKEMLYAMVIFGTEFVSKPKEVASMTSNDWVAKLELTGVKTYPQNKQWRYLQWVLSVAIMNTDDFTVLSEKVGKLNGVSEADVESAAKFPGN